MELPACDNASAFHIKNNYDLTKKKNAGTQRPWTASNTDRHDARRCVWY